MQFILRYLKPYGGQVTGGMTAKFLGTLMDLLIPWLLAFILDDIVPLQSLFYY